MPECKRVWLTGTVRVSLPVKEAFSLFTPEGMRAWRPSWDPRFPVGGDNPNQPGTVFDSEHDGHVTTWVVVQCEPGQSLIFARVKVDMRGGLVTINLEELPDGTTEATISYDLTTLNPEANADQDEYAAQYPQMLRDWEQRIAQAITES